MRGLRHSCARREKCPGRGLVLSQQTEQGLSRYAERADDVHGLSPSLQRWPPINDEVHGFVPLSHPVFVTVLYAGFIPAPLEWAGESCSNFQTFHLPSTRMQTEVGKLRESR